MALTTGTASNYYDLLDKLRLWLTGSCGWTQLAWTPNATPLTNNTQSYLSLKGPGAGTGREVYINIKTNLSIPAQSYWWEISGAVGYQAVAAWGNQPGAGRHVCFNTWQNAIDYWFYANDRRFIVVVKCSTIYISAYGGMFLPWANPAQYPFPLLVAADYQDPCAYNYVNSARRCCADPGFSLGGNPYTSSAYCRDPSGTWNPMANHWNSASNDYTQGYNQRGAAYYIWPFSTAADWNSPLSWALGSQASSGGTLDLMVPTAQGDRMVLPVHLMHTRLPALGVMDGIYKPLGSGLVTEQTVTADSLPMRAFQNIHRNSANDMFLIHEV